MIEFQDVTFTYPGAENAALKNVNLKIEAGKFTLVTGVSGSGKSTLLRCLNGLVPHFSGGRLSGIVRVDGLDPVECSPKVMSRHVGFVFQDPETQFVLNLVEDDIAFSLENAALEPELIRERLEKIIEQLNLQALRSRRIETLSGGERQRVAIAAALVPGPDILVLDEPTSQLDPVSAGEVLETVRQLKDRMGLTVILAEHRLERVLPYTDQVVYMDIENGSVISAPAREAVRMMGIIPPVTQLGLALNWEPLPLCVQEARAHLEADEAKGMAKFENGAILGVDAPQREEAPATEVYIQAEDVHVILGGQPVLRGISMELRRGEILALMGPNGAGKTTLLRTLVGLQKAESGRVLVAKEDIRTSSVAEICRKVGFLPQDPNSLLFAESVVDELLVTLQNHGYAVDDGWINRLLKDLKIDHLAWAYPRDLSAGQRQRVALGAIMVTQPQALLLDEPTRGLDALMKQDLGEILKDWKAQGKGILVVTHDVEFAAGMADRVLIMDQGSVIASGATAKVLDRSPGFAPQMAQLFPGRGWLRVEEVLAFLRIKSA